MKRLTQKAQLLGYSDDPGDVSGETRGKIAPGLTNDFVNYFNGILLATALLAM